LDDWLPEDHLARFISDIVDELDLSSIYAYYERESRGYPPYEPSMMFKILMYAYATGVYSSRKIERRIYEDIAFRYLAAGNFPDFRTISTFRKRHLQDFERLFLQVLQLCRRAGLVKLGTIAIDGTKIKANASRHKAMSYGRMKQEEVRLDAEIKQLLAKAEKADDDENRRYGDHRGDEPPEELRFRQKRLEKIREAMKALEEEAKKHASPKRDDHKKDDDDSDGDASSAADDSVPVDDKAQRNFTDPDSRIMKGPGKQQFIQGYNVQISVDAETQVILATDVTQSSSDTKSFSPMLDAVEANVGRPQRVTADAGYYSAQNVLEARRRKVAPFIPPQKVKHSEWREDCPRGPLPDNATLRQRMARFIRTKRGKAVYKQRQTSVEPVFGQIKGVRGFRSFSLRGLSQVKGEWNLVALVHNALKLFTHKRTAAEATM
jgi:transposase